MRRCTLPTCLLALGLLALALPCNAVPAEPCLSGDPGGGITALDDGDTVIIDHRHVELAVAFGTASVSHLFPHADAVFCSHVLSNELAQVIEAGGMGNPPGPTDPRLTGFSTAYGGMSNLEFLLGPNPDLGDPVAAVMAVFQQHLDAINAAIGGGATMTVDPAQVTGPSVYGLYGGVLEDTPPGHTTIITGQGNTTFHEVNAVITVPDDAFIIPEPATMGLLAVGGIGLLVRRRRRGHASGRPLR